MLNGFGDEAAITAARKQVSAHGVEVAYSAADLMHANQVEALVALCHGIVARHPLIEAGLRDSKAGKKLPPLVDSPQAGATEALYGIGASLTRRGGEDLALVYLQLALYLQPDHALALLSLADLYEAVKKPQMAIKVYERVPADSPIVFLRP